MEVVLSAARGPERTPPSAFFSLEASYFCPPAGGLMAITEMPTVQLGLLVFFS